MGTVHIHAPRATAKRVVTGHCHDCNKRTRFVEFFTPWYGWDSTCLRCGRKWCDGEWMALPFMRGAREHNRAAAKSHWARMPPVANNHFGIDQ
jgi:hypothetical protein